MFKQIDNFGGGHVVCCNDSINAIYIGRKRNAERLLRKLAARDYVKFFVYMGRHWTYEYYRSNCYWHLHQATIY